MTTFAIPEELSAYHKAQLESFLKFADASVAATEQWFDLNFKTAKAGTTELIKQARALASAKDVQELSALHTTFSQANAEKAAGFAKAVHSWATETQGEVTKLVDAHMAEVNRTLAAAVEKASKSAPSGSEFAFAAVKQAMSAANQAYDAIAKAGKQVADMTESAVSATTATVTGAAKKKVA